MIKQKIKRFEEFALLSWNEWDEFDDGKVFYGVKLNPDFFIGNEDTYALLKKYEGDGLEVSFDFGACGFTISFMVYNPKTDEKIVGHTIEGVISYGKSINKD